MVMNFDGDRVININVGKGIYLLSNKGSDGKTYLCTISRYLQSVGESCKVITYNPEYKDEDDYVHELLQSGGKALLFIDRFDLYSSDKILEVAKEHYDYIFVDWKHKMYSGSSDGFDDVVYLDFDKGGFTIE